MGFFHGLSKHPQLALQQANNQRKQFPSPEDRTKMTQEVFCMFGFQRNKSSVCSACSVSSVSNVRNRRYVWSGT